MRVLRMAAMALAIVGGYLASPNLASAAPIGAGALLLTQSVGNPLVDKAQYFYVRRRPYRPYRHYYRPYRYYRPYVYRRPIYRPYGYYRPRVVCRIRYTAWGPRRVCWRPW
jgi:hypothetical protein